MAHFCRGDLASTHDIVSSALYPSNKARHTTNMHKCALIVVTAALEEWGRWQNLQINPNLKKNGKSPLTDCSCVEIPWSCAEMCDFFKHSSAFHLTWWNSSSYHFCCPGLLVPFLAGQYRRWVFSRGDGFHRNSPSGVHSCCRPSSIFNHAFLKSTL